MLLDEERKVVDGLGKTSVFVRYAVRVLTNEGRSKAIARMVYRTDTGKVKNLSAWLVTPSGTIKEYGKKETADLALAENDVYSESRVRSIIASMEAIPGSVFGFEGEAEDKSVFTQHEWLFQTSAPALTSRFVLQLPPGWRAEAKSYNQQPLEPKVSGSTWVWERQDLSPIEPEEAGPGVGGLAPRIAVSYFPPQGTAPDAPAFSTWPEVSRWLSSLNDPQTVADAALKAKAAELTASAATAREKIESVGQFAQKIKYVSIQIGVGRGGGYRPHAATEVLSKLYGDCKDKSNLMRALLKEAGIDSYPVAIFSGDPTYVRPDWPSPHQFNHAILAIGVPADFESPAVSEVPGIGRLLFFDPTDENTPLGYLPEHEQGSYALIVDPERGALVQAPKASPEANHLERTIKAQLNADGSLVAMVEERCSGQSAAYNRRLHRATNESDYRKIIERWVAGGVPGARVEKIEAADRSPDFALDVELSAPTYGQVMNDRLWMFSPSLIERRGWYGLGQTKRTQPFLLDADSYSEVVEILLPKGFKVDEVPPAVKMKNGFGSFDASWEHADGILIFKRRFRTEGGSIPAADYAELRKFLRGVEGAARAAVVLEKP
ncbi:MAG: DUF3857 domain-containing protein [Bryobacterales bacterium]|nr:DUF3857 domain-containing protein [Bryobacterales bacterium]